MDMAFINENFMLTCDAARELYHKGAEGKPIIDYHCHLNPEQIATNIQFKDITQLWLAEDHYKWRALRANGVTEDYVTGNGRSSWEKFSKWAETVPYLMRNPLYHWTHLELSRVFGINKLLSPATARDIFEQCNDMLAREDFRGQALIRKFGVEAICTTDDPADDLRWHKMIADNPFGTKVLPTWRPDKAVAIENPVAYKAYLEKLSQASGMEIGNYRSLMDALQKRHDFFAANGCRLSDHGLETFFYAPYTPSEVEAIFQRVLQGKAPTAEELAKFRAAFFHDVAVMDAESGWVQQFHVGPLRNNNSALFNSFGPDAGCDSLHDLPIAYAGNKYLDSLAKEGKLAKTILYCLNSKDNDTLMSMAYNFNDGSIPGKMQFGAAWWFLDQEDGIRRQLNVLSSQGLLSRFVGMLTDSRSFISYTRHEYFRRILCDVIGTDVENGKLPKEEMEFLIKMVGDISYGNAKKYFDF